MTIDVTRGATGDLADHLAYHLADHLADRLADHLADIAHRAAWKTRARI
jgi:hypothetical protein